MGVGQTESVAIKKYLDELLLQMQKPIVYVPNEQPVAATSLSKKIPFLSRFIKNSGEIGGEVLQLNSSISGLSHPASVALSNGLQFGGVSLASIDFLLIPAIYLSAFILGEKLPISLNNNARWAYAAVLVALAMVAIFVPVTAPAMGLAVGSLTLGLSSFLLGKALYERYQLGKERKHLQNEIGRQENEMQRIQEQATELQKNLNTLPEGEYWHEPAQQIAFLQEQYEAQKKLLLELKAREQVVTQKIKKLDILHVMDKALAVGLGVLAIGGLVLALFIPPVGLGILVGLSVFSLSYLGARIISPWISKVGHWLSNKLFPLVDLPGSEHDLQNKQGLGDRIEKGSSYNSTTSSNRTSLSEDSLLSFSNNSTNSTRPMLEKLLGSEEKIDISMNWDYEEDESDEEGEGIKESQEDKEIEEIDSIDESSDSESKVSLP